MEKSKNKYWFRKKRYIGGSNQLSEEDFKNIWARLWLKLWWIAILAVGFFFTGGLIIIKSTSEKIVNSYIDKNTILKQFDTEKKQILEKVSFDMKQIKERFMKEVKTCSVIPFNINQNSITMFDSSGNRFMLEFGEGLTNQIVEFKQPFSVAPIIIANFKDSISDSQKGLVVGPMGRGVIKISNLTIQADKKSFIPVYSRQKTAYGEIKEPKFPISWVAFGK